MTSMIVLPKNQLKFANFCMKLQRKTSILPKFLKTLKISGWGTTFYAFSDVSKCFQTLPISHNFYDFFLNFLEKLTKELIWKIFKLKKKLKTKERTQGKNQGLGGIRPLRVPEA